MNPGLKIRVLVVDDEPKIVELIREVLEANHCEVATASSGAEALLRTGGYQPDLILLDVVMPQMNGFEVLQKLRADVSTRQIPVVMVTTRTDTTSILKAQELRATDYVIKPFDLEVLVQTVKRCAKVLPE